MCRSLSAIGRPTLLLALALSATACRGAAQAPEQGLTPTVEIVLNDTRMETEFARSIDELDRRARAVLAEMGVRITNPPRVNDKARREYEARSVDRIVQVTMERRGPNHTKIAVASMRLVQGRGQGLEYDTRHARLVVERI